MFSFEYNYIKYFHKHFGQFLFTLLYKGYVSKEDKKMINIFDYTDFRKYLTDYYEDRKKEKPRFSYRFLKTQLGVNQGVFAKMLKEESNFKIA